MNIVEQLEASLEVAGKLGYRVRYEWLGGQGGGACQFRGQRWLFLDLGLGPADHLEVVSQALLNDPAIFSIAMDERLRAVLKLPRAA